MNALRLAIGFGLATMLMACSNGNPSSAVDMAMASVDMTMEDDMAMSEVDLASPLPKKNYGEACTMSSQCKGGLCLTPGACSQPCTQATPNDCRSVGGLCIPYGAANLNKFGCVGNMLNTGPDVSDDAILTPGDSLTRAFDSLADTDMFQLHFTTTVEHVVTVHPIDSGVDVAFDVYTSAGALGSTQNKYGADMDEALTITPSGEGYDLFVIVKNVGATSAGYKISVSP